MTIQLSLVVWTVICFLALVAILHFLLFRPVLDLLDRRRERIAAARELRDKRAELAERYESEALANGERLVEESRESVRREIIALRADGKARIESANRDRLHGADAYRAKAESECSELLELLRERADEIAVSFAESLVK